MRFTSSQQQAIAYHEGPLLIIAGAGTGKTSVLVEKIKYLIDQQLAQPEQILGLTFTEKSAIEMETRLDEMLRIGFTQSHISTFHSFCDSILREDSLQIGISPTYTLHTQAQSILYMKKNLFRFEMHYFRPLGNPYKFIEGLLAHFSRLRDEDISHHQYSAFAHQLEASSVEEREEKEKIAELARIYAQFQELKIRDGIFDFADLITYALILLRTRTNVLNQYQKRFPYILIDEFQDTNLAQYELIKLLASPEKNPHLTLVGDDSQSIYKFRGAAISNILQFMDDYKTARKIVLLENFRSNQSILDASYRLIKHNDPDTLETRLGISKNLISNQEKGEKTDLTFYYSPQAHHEAEYVAEQIIRLHKEGHAFSDFALLVRANNHADVFTSTFARYGIPSQFLGKDMLFKQKEIKELIAYLQFLANIEDNASLYRVLTMWIFALDTTDIARLLAFTKKTSLSLFQCIEAYLEVDLYKSYIKYLAPIKSDTKEKLIALYTMIKKHLSDIPKKSAGAILYSFLDTTGILKWFSSEMNEKKERQILNISQFFTLLQSLQTKGIDTRIPEVVEYLTMSMEFGDSPSSELYDHSSYDAVNISTVHGSKGLEFPIVFLVNLSIDRFPSRRRRETIPLDIRLIKEILPSGDYHLQEERRLFYVGLTRAKKKIFLSASKFYGEGVRMRKISPFIQEALGERYFTLCLTQGEQKATQLTIFDFSDKESIPLQKKHTDMPKLFLSYSQIETYKLCPLKYQYQYILKIPTTPQPVTSFGETIHKTLYFLYQGVQNKNPFSLSDLFAFYHRAWIPIGYSSTVYEEKMRKEGESMLTHFFNNFYDKTVLVQELESMFKFFIGEDCTLVGKIDRIDKKTDNLIEIIDYKTGKKPEEKELKKSLQLAIYALAMRERGVLSKNILLTFYFLLENKKVSFTKTDEELYAVKEELTEIKKEIGKSNFAPRVGPWCTMCPFKINCEAWQ